MNFVRAAFTKGCTAIAVCRPVAQRTLTSTFEGTIKLRNYSTNKTIAVNNIIKSKDVPTNLEIKIQQLEVGALSTPTYQHLDKDSSVPLHSADKDSKPTAKTNPNKTVNIQTIKRTMRKKRSDSGKEDFSAQGFFNVAAFSTAEEYDLESLLDGLQKQNLYTAKKFFSTDNLGMEQDVLYVTAKYQLDTQTRDIYFFREGSVVLWNFNEIETNNILSFLRRYEKDSYLKPLVMGESEVMPYTYIPQSAVDVEGDLVEVDLPKQAFFQNGKFYLTCGEENFLQKYTFSNAMATSIKLGIWEATLDRYIHSMEYLTEDLKKGRRIRISRPEVLRKTGELFALRHVINLSSDLLDTPDFYWDREELETLYLQVCAYFSISRRTKVMNEKINHCVELAELISHNLNDAHHIRLEWMIIILIMVEVGFEIVHYMDRFYAKEEVHKIENNEVYIKGEGQAILNKH